MTWTLLAKAGAQQVMVENHVWDFGTVAYWKNDTAYFTVRNAGGKDLIFLPTHYKEDVRVIFDRRNASPGERLDIKIVYYTEHTGKFEVEVPLYFNLSMTPVVFKLKGNIKRIDPNALVRCPQVNAGKEEVDLRKVINIEVRDRVTEALLEADQLWIRDRGNKKIETERSGNVYEALMEPGEYRVGASKKGYDDYMAVIRLEPYQQRFVIYMDKQLTDTVPQVKEEELPEDGVFVDEGPEEHEHPMDSFHQEKPNRDTSELDIDLFAPNNIVLIVDISTSMKKEDKLLYLKMAMKQMIEVFRTVDRVAIVALSSDASILLTPVMVENKDTLKAVIENMSAGGGTNGAAAIKLAYELATKHFVQGGNNQIIIATDGMFGNSGMTRKELNTLISSKNEAGIHLSAMGFGNNEKALAYLKSLTLLGGGDFIHITNELEAQTALIERLKKQSKK